MKALVFEGPGRKSLRDVPTPQLQHPHDAIVRITHTTICGTDLHILKGDVPEVTSGRVLGHEGVGEIVSVGPAVSRFKPRDSVIISCITSCGACGYCRRGMFSHCDDGGWQLGHTIDGTQAEFVRIPHADNSLHPAAPSADKESLVLLSDVLPTAYECGVLSGCIRPGNTVAVIGAGPIGLGVLLTAKLFSPAQLIAVDTDATRLERAHAFGATMLVDSEPDGAAEAILEATNRRGVDVAVEAVGIPATFELCQNIIAPGGHIANIGVHGKPATLHLERLWAANITLTTRLVDTLATPELLAAVIRNSLNPARMITHRFALANLLDAYDTFSTPQKSNALKMLITA
ncbi:MAG TPA: zinc-dependent alcohol dehydrogenase family protein [Phycisphaerae bacterium]|nr:zinc-dependent alcohol dehydrogenase family protein [Phycisphaerae bacterium]